MSLAANILITLIALLHIYFLVLEMFLWDKPLGMKTFGLSKEFAAASKVLAANQGLYNGCLAAGLFWGLVVNNFQIKVFFLGCILIAGIYGAYSTGRKKILYIQAVPAAIALVLLHF